MANLGTVKGKKKEIEESDEMEAKKRKLFGSENEKNLEVKFSLSAVKNKYKDASLPPNWNAFHTIIFNEREEGLHDTEKIAAFDFDGCLANTSVKRIGADAWSLMYPSIPEKLQELYNGGHKLVIFTNESNIERWKNKRQQAIDSKIGRLDNFIKRVKVPIQVFVACGLGNNKMAIDDPFRKPMTGMWKIFANDFNSGIAIDMNQSFYVGDAAGRAKDHSDADIKFAQLWLEDVSNLLEIDEEERTEVEEGPQALEDADVLSGTNILLYGSEAEKFIYLRATDILRRRWVESWMSFRDIPREEKDL